MTKNSAEASQANDFGLTIWPSVKLHACGDQGPHYEFSFDPDEPAPWCPIMFVTVEDCAREKLSQDEIKGMLDALPGLLRPAQQADAMSRIVMGEETCDEKGACAILGVGATKLNDYRRAGKVPEPVVGLNGKNTWLVKDLRLALALLMTEQGLRKARGGRVTKKAPVNRYVKAKV